MAQGREQHRRRCLHFLSGLLNTRMRDNMRGHKILRHKAFFPILRLSSR